MQAILTDSTASHRKVGPTHFMHLIATCFFGLPKLYSTSLNPFYTHKFQKYKMICKLEKHPLFTWIMKRPQNEKFSMIKGRIQIAWRLIDSFLKWINMKISSGSGKQTITANSRLCYLLAIIFSFVLILIFFKIYFLLLELEGKIVLLVYLTITNPWFPIEIDPNLVYCIT